MNIGTAKTLAKMIVDRKAELKFVAGSGEINWDDFSPPKFPDNKELLYNETYRGAIKSVQYVNPDTFEDVAQGTLTNAIKIVGTIPSNSGIDGTYVREKAIFLGGDTKNTGNLIHAETSSLEVKTAGKESETTLIIVIR